MRLHVEHLNQLIHSLALHGSLGTLVLLKLQGTSPLARSGGSNSLENLLSGPILSHESCFTLLHYLSEQLSMEHHTMASKMIQLFIRALKKAEKTRELEPLVSLFTEDTEISNLATVSPFYGKAGAYRFWKDYLSTFQKVETRFIRIIELNQVAVLEWHSEGILSSGRPFHYSGTTILDIDKDLITRFRSYYDSAVFVEPGALRRAA
jgi:hypothetical protein